jgi:hypothetical protein
MKKGFYFILAACLMAGLVCLNSCATGSGKNAPQPKVTDYSLIINNTCPYKIRVTVSSVSNDIFVNGTKYKVSTEAKEAKGVAFIAGQSFDFFGSKKGEIILKVTDTSGGAAKMTDIPLKLSFKSENVVDPKNNKAIDYSYNTLMKSHKISLASDGHTYTVKFEEDSTPEAQPAAAAQGAEPAAGNPAAKPAVPEKK